MHRAGSAVTLLAALSLCSWSFASAASLEVDGGVVQYWELDAGLSAEDPADERDPDAVDVESDESQGLSDADAVEEQLTSPPAPAIPSQPEAHESAREASEPTPSETESATPEGPPDGSETEPIAEPSVNAP